MVSSSLYAHLAGAWGYYTPRCFASTIARGSSLPARGVNPRGVNPPPNFRIFSIYMFDSRFRARGGRTQAMVDVEGRYG